MKKSLLLIFSAIVLVGCTDEKALPVADQAETEKIISEYESKLSEYELKISEYESKLSEYEEKIRIYEEDTLGYSIIFPDEDSESDSTVYADESTEYSSIGQYGNATPEELAESIIFKGVLEKDLFYIANFDYSTSGTTEEKLESYAGELEGLTAEDITIEVYEGKYSEYAADVKVKATGGTVLALNIDYDADTGWVITDY